MSPEHKKLFWFLALSVVIPFVIYTAYYYRQAIAVHYNDEDFDFILLHRPDTLVLLARDAGSMDQVRQEWHRWEQSVIKWQGSPPECVRMEKILSPDEAKDLLLELKALSYFQYPDTLSFDPDQPGGLPYREWEELWYVHAGYGNKAKWIFWNQQTSTQNRRAQNLRRLSHFLVEISLQNRE